MEEIGARSGGELPKSTSFVRSVVKVHCPHGSKSQLSAALNARGRPEFCPEWGVCGSRFQLATMPTPVECIIEFSLTWYRCLELKANCHFIHKPGIYALPF